VIYYKNNYTHARTHARTHACTYTIKSIGFWACLRNSRAVVRNYRRCLTAVTGQLLARSDTYNVAEGTSK